MRERVETLVGGRARAMWVMTFHSACARMLRADAAAARLHARLHDLRRAGLAAARQELHRGARRRPAALRAARHPAPDLGRQERAARRRGLPAQGRQLLRADRRRRLRPLRAAPARGQRDGLRRPAVPLREPVRALRGGARPLPALVPARARRRVPGHEPRPVPLAPAALRGAPQPLRGRRRRPVDLRLARRRRPQHPRLRGRLPGRHGRQARAELPLDADDPERGQRGDRQQPLAQGQDALERARRRRSGPRARAGGRARRGALRRLGDRAARGRGRLARRHRGLLPDQRPEPRARGHARPLRRPVPGHRRHPLLRARRDQGRARVPDAAREPVRHGRLRADRQLAAARDRADVAGAAGGLREHASGEPIWDVACAPETVPRPRRGGGQGGRPVHVGDASGCASAPRPARGSATCSRTRSRRPATPRRCRRSARSRRRGASRTSRSWSGSGASTTRPPRRARSRSSSSRSRCSPSRTTCATSRASSP